MLQMLTTNVPIQTIAICSTIGELKPLRFRYENEEHVIQTVDVNEVLSIKESNLAGINSLLYTCKAILDKRECLFILKYNVMTHTWIFYKMLS